MALGSLRSLFRGLTRTRESLAGALSGLTGGGRIDEAAMDGLEAALRRGALLVDVREPKEYRQGHVPSAVNIPMGELADRLDVLRDLGPVHLICRSGNRSSAMVPLLVRAGIDVVDVPGGTDAWAHAGKPVEEGA